MTARIAILFLKNGKPSPVFLGAIRQKGALQGLQPVEIVSGGYANSYFRSWWRVAFPAKRDLPDDPIARKDGRGTQEFWDVFS